MPAVRIKVCGLTRPEDALLACRLGADAAGFIFYKKSPRYICPEEAGRITALLPPFVSRVGVFVDESPERVRDVFRIAGLDIAQLHGQEPPESLPHYPGRIIKAFRVQGQESLQELSRYSPDAFLLDTYRPGQPGGTGAIFDWSVAVQAKQAGPVILAGGLGPDNIAEAIRTVEPYGVDVSSGVESEPGIKDPEKLRRFIITCRSLAEE